MTISSPIERARRHTQLFPPHIATFSLIIALFLSAVIWQTFTPVMGLFHDDAIYATNARSLAQGDGYRLMNLPTTPEQTKYPPFYAMCLSVVWWFFPDFPRNVFALKGLNTLFAFTGLMSMALLLSRTERRSTCAPTLGQFALGTSPAFVQFTNYTMTESLFTMLVLLVILTWGEARSTKRLHLDATAMLLVALAILTRSVGVALTLGIALDCLFRRQWKRALMHSLWGFAVTGLWAVWAMSNRSPWSALLSYYVEYEKPAFTYVLGNPNLAVSIIVGNARLLLDAAFFTVGPGWQLFWPVIAPLALGGGWHLFKSGWRMPFYFSGVYLTLVLMHPFSPQRYLLPLLPVFVLTLVVGAFTVRDVARRWWGRSPVALRLAPVVVIAITVILGNSLWLLRWLNPMAEVRAWHGFSMGYRWEGFAETFSWIKQNTPDDAVLGGIFDPMYHLYTGRLAVRPWLHRPETYFYPYGAPQPDVGTPDQVLRELRNVGVTHIVFDPPAGYAEGPAAIEMLKELVKLPEANGRLMFTSSDGLHQVYSISPGK